MILCGLMCKSLYYTDLYRSWTSFQLFLCSYALRVNYVLSTHRSRSSNIILYPEERSELRVAFACEIGF